MKRFVTVLGVGVAVSLGTPNGAGASHDPSGAPFDEDFVTGTAFLVDSTVTLDAHSGPSGEDARGSVVFSSGLVGSVTCLRVEDNRATIGIQFPTFQGFYYIVDNGEGENDQITADVAFTPPTECPSPTHVGAFDGWEHVNVIVHDAPPLPTSKDQCQNGGWQTFGVFRNQGDCVSFVATKGKNPPGGGAQTPTGDSVTGSGVSPEAFCNGPVEIDARSGPSGENPTGQVTCGSLFSGPVTCLNVQGNIALLTVQDSRFGAVGVRITDAGTTGDRIESYPVGPGCPIPLSRYLPIEFTGDIVVVDAPPLPISTEQ